MKKFRVERSEQLKKINRRYDELKKNWNKKI